MSKKISIIVDEEDDGIRLDRWFKRYYPHVKHVHLQKMLRKKYIRINGKKAEASERVAKNQEITLPEVIIESVEVSKKPKTYEHTKEQLDSFKEMILYEDERIVVINKPHKLAVQGGSGILQSVDSLAQQFWQDKEERPRLVHRIDKDTSGLLMMAKTASMAAELTKALRQKEIKKTYLALVKNVPKKNEGVIDLPLIQEKYNGNERMAVNEEYGKKSQTHYKVIDKVGNEMAFLELSPVTGRKHQLRVHMAFIGCPIIGDKKYGGKEAVIQGISERLHLHAYSLKIPFLKKKFTAPIPDHMKGSISYLGLSMPE